MWCVKYAPWSEWFGLVAPVENPLLVFMFTYIRIYLSISLYLYIYL